MGWIADLLKEIPTAAKYKADLESMERENASLRSSVTALRTELDRLRASGQSSSPIMNNLDRVAESVLAFIAKNQDSFPSQISRALGIVQNIVDMHLDDLQGSKYIDASCAVNQEPRFYLEQVGRRYLHTRGLLE
jgi:hypothetical protein